MDQKSVQVEIKSSCGASNSNEDFKVGEDTNEVDKDYLDLDSGPGNRRCPSVKRILGRVPEPIKSSLRPPLTCKDWLEFLMIKLPIIQLVWTYKLEYIISDIVAGMTVAIFHVPQGLAYALLANVPPVFGLYTAFIAPLIYSVVGTSRHLSVGTFAVIQLIVGNSVESILVGFDELKNCTVSADDQDTDLVVFFHGELTTCNEVKADTVFTLAFLSGIIMLVMGLLMLGFVSIFLSEPLVSGYTTAAAVHVFNSQLQHITGLGSLIAVPPGLFRIPKTWIAMLENLGSINWATAVVSVVAIITLIVFKFGNTILLSSRLHLPIKIYNRNERKWIKKKYSWPLPVPAALIVIVIATLIAYFGKFEERFNVASVGNVPNGLPGTSLPRVKLFSHLIQDAFVVAIISYSISVSISKVAAKDLGYKINSNQEFLALGVTNIFGSFFSSFSASGSLSRTSLQMSSGGKTQVASILASCFVLVVLIKIGSLVEPLPKAVLASLIWVSLINMFKKFKDVYTYSKISLWDGAVWITVFIATTLLGVEIGLAVGVAFSLLTILIRIILPTSSTSNECVDNQERFSDGGECMKGSEHPGVCIYKFQAPLCFLNCSIFQQQLERACNMYTNADVDWESEGCLQTLLYKCGMMKRKNIFEESGPQRKDFIHLVIIDCSAINFIDSVAVSTITKVVEDFEFVGIQVKLASLSYTNAKMLLQSPFFKQHSKECVFPSVREALGQTRYIHTQGPLSATNYLATSEVHKLPQDSIDNCSTNS